MASWYSVGTVYCVNGTTAVNGTGTDFTVGARVGDGIKMPDGNIYEIAAIGNATSLTLGENYAGSTINSPGSAYSIIQTQNLTSTLAGQVSTLINDYQTGLDSISGGIFQAANGAVTTPSLTFASDTNTGIYSIAADNLGVAVSGVKVLDLVSTGVNADLRFLDNKKATFGTSDDLQVYHSGTDSFVTNNTGDLYLRTNADDRDVIIQSDNGSGALTTYFIADGSTGGVNLYNYGAVKLATTSTGIDVTGQMESDSAGIGGAAVQQKLEVHNGGLLIDGNIVSPTSGTSGVLIDYISGAARYWARGADATTNGSHGFYVLENDGGNQIEAVRISGSGYVGINQTSPSAKLHVKSSDPLEPPIIAESTQTNGVQLFADFYTGGSGTTQESSVSLGKDYATNGFSINAFVKNSNTTKSTFLSSQDNFSAQGASLQVCGTAGADYGIKFYTSSVNATRTVNTVNSDMKEVGRFNANGSLSIKSAGTSSGNWASATTDGLTLSGSTGNNNNFSYLTTYGDGTGLILGAGVTQKNGIVIYGQTFTSGNYVAIKSGGLEQLTVTGTAGDVRVNNGNLVIGTAGKGIDFSASSNPAGMENELLADYESGTWTATSAVSLSPNSTPSYTKIGNLVTIFFDITVATNSNSADFNMALPFVGITGEYGCGTVNYNTTNSLIGSVNIDGNVGIKLRNNVQAANLAYQDLSGARIIGSATYRSN